MSDWQTNKDKPAIIGCPDCFNLVAATSKSVEIICDKCGAKLVRCNDKTLEPLK